jgi:two-component system, NarL family, invasion response regulator UvrY
MNVMGEPLPVLVVDDQAPFRLAAKAVVGQLSEFVVVAEAASGTEAITLADVHRPALILMDINMPDINGIEATRRIVSGHPDTVVILCSTYEFEDLPPGAADSGARAYLNKERLSTATLRRLWDERDIQPFTSG